MKRSATTEMCPYAQAVRLLHSICRHTLLLQLGHGTSRKEVVRFRRHEPYTHFHTVVIRSVSLSPRLVGWGDVSARPTCMWAGATHIKT